ncbi:protein TonB [Palleronia marisminoris]|uniref:Gram-negative bacterial tonB protein n=1 Tax=Palleronia marisminoris TaxID=315423 RepID=A0A1Y5TLB3_9RHOB|nr:TonB family protein [Palleronia marisminoris]SFH43496.1 protein TonB [Palleronia marisminoris]SLN66645.1 Gram-negative bacterial tonB protein [Palleronia marisminoris]
MTIPSSIRAKTTATALSVMALAAGLVMGVRSAPVEIAGGGSAAPSQLGSSFADLAAGTEVAEPTETVQAADPVEPTEAAEPTEPVEATPPEPTSDAQPTDPTPAQPAEPTEAVPQEAPTPPTPVQAVPVQTADPTLPAMPDVVTADAPDPVAPVQAAPPEPVEPSRPETITGEELPPGVVVSSRRPPTRSEAFEARHRRPDPPPQPEPQRQQPTPTRQAQAQPTATQQGNSDRSERAGSQQDTGGNASGATGQRQASQAGNAAASNYPGQVMSRLSRVPRPSVRAAGSAVISFAVAGSGGLANVGIARSSGSAALDRAAVQLVRRAAPFPAPPPGAQRSFSITIAGR